MTHPQREAERLVRMARSMGATAEMMPSRTYYDGKRIEYPVAITYAGRIGVLRVASFPEPYDKRRRAGTTWDEGLRIGDAESASDALPWLADWMEIPEDDTDPVVLDAPAHVRRFATAKQRVRSRYGAVSQAGCRALARTMLTEPVTAAERMAAVLNSGEGGRGETQTRLTLALAEEVTPETAPALALPSEIHEEVQTKHVPVLATRLGMQADPEHCWTDELIRSAVWDALREFPLEWRTRQRMYARYLYEFLLSSGTDVSHTTSAVGSVVGAHVAWNDSRALLPIVVATSRAEVALLSFLAAPAGAGAKEPWAHFSGWQQWASTHRDETPSVLPEMLEPYRNLAEMWDEVADAARSRPPLQLSSTYWPTNDAQPRLD